MSKLTIQVDQFLIDTLQPEIDGLNLSLIAMEEMGYNNSAIIDTRRKLNKLITYYDFLKEYAYGNEEADDVIITDMMKLVGKVTVSRKSLEPNVQAVRSSLDINESRPNYDVIRVYLDDEILLSNTITSSDAPITFKVHSSNTANKIEVTYTATGMVPVKYTGVTSVTIPNVEINATDVITLDVVTYNNGVELINTQFVYNILYANCSQLLFWVGSTTERFKIDSILDESSDISITPNDGTLVAGTTLDYDWIINNPIDMIEKMFREDTTLRVSVAPTDAHALILLPNNLEISDISEVIVDLDIPSIDDNGLSEMTQGLHYEIFNINSPIRKYKCIYFRDLTNVTFPDRTFQFNIKYIQ